MPPLRRDDAVGLYHRIKQSKPFEPFTYRQQIPFSYSNKW